MNTYTPWFGEDFSSALKFFKVKASEVPTESQLKKVLLAGKPRAKVSPASKPSCPIPRVKNISTVPPKGPIFEGPTTQLFGGKASYSTQLGKRSEGNDCEVDKRLGESSLPALPALAKTGLWLNHMSNMCTNMVSGYISICSSIFAFGLCHWYIVVINESHGCWRATVLVVWIEVPQKHVVRAQDEATGHKSHESIERPTPGDLRSTGHSLGWPSRKSCHQESQSG